jgi:hypothetical protein
MSLSNDYNLRGIVLIFSADWNLNVTHQHATPQSRSIFIEGWRRGGGPSAQIGMLNRCDIVPMCIQFLQGIAALL